MDFFSTLIEIGFYIFLGFLALAVIGAIQDGKKGKTSTGGRPFMVHANCPYCGHDCGLQHFSGRANNPQLFTCGDCYRKFGNVSLMSSSEKSIYQVCNADCARAEKLPELGTIISSVEQHIWHTPGRGEDWIQIQNGQVHALSFSGGNVHKKLLCTYQGSNGKIFDQHLATLCIRHFKTKYPYPWIRYQYSDAGFYKVDSNKK